MFKKYMSDDYTTVRSHGRHGVPNHRQFEWLLSSLFKSTSNLTYMLRITGFLALCEGNPTLTWALIQYKDVILPV